MIEWTACSKAMPTERGEYIIYNAATEACLAPIPWITNADGTGGMWVGLFATPEAGVTYMPPAVTHWAKWNGPPEESNAQ